MFSEDHDSIKLYINGYIRRDKFYRKVRKKFPWMGKVGYKRIQLAAEKKKHYLILQSD